MQVEKYDSSDVVTQDWKNIYQTLMETSDHNTEKPEVDGKEGEDGEENNVLAKSEEAGGTVLLTRLCIIGPFS